MDVLFKCNPILYMRFTWSEWCKYPKILQDKISGITFANIKCFWKPASHSQSFRGAKTRCNMFRICQGLLQHHIPACSENTFIQYWDPEQKKSCELWCLVVLYLSLIWVELPEMKWTLFCGISEDIWSRVSPRARVLRGSVKSLKQTKHGLTRIHPFRQLPLQTLWDTLSVISVWYLEDHWVQYSVIKLIWS